MTASDDAQDAKLTTLYHGACPVCGREVSHYQRYAGERALPLGWEDVSDGRAAPLMEAHGIDREAAKKRLHVVTPDGRLLSGVDAFQALWAEMPRYRWLAKLVGLPIVKPIARLVYDRLLAPALYAANRRAGR
ncbi:MAG: DUF393 domain-containing protein [Marivibrio sp.]|uniref:thiol-disulfide oxidoreductase DCC family protein n=1 Tax=Marivibrio sp. TaxID=2039719 RepID=UPI0032EB90B4